MVVVGGSSKAWGLPLEWDVLARYAVQRFHERSVPAITGDGLFYRIHMMNNHTVSWHLPRTESVKTLVQEFLENVGELLRQFMYSLENTTRYNEMIH
eukprot:3359366-Amphidinium_carterae.1